MNNTSQLQVRTSTCCNAWRWCWRGRWPRVLTVAPTLCTVEIPALDQSFLRTEKATTVAPHLDHITDVGFNMFKPTGREGLEQ